MPRKTNVSFTGQVPEFDPAGTENRSDYRPVPASDRNSQYGDRGGFGTYQTNDGKPWGDPEGLKRFAGYGATEADLARGFIEPTIRNDPAYDGENYKDRSTVPMLSDLDEGGDSMNDDYAFRRRNERARGFLTRPHIPTDR
jgi:hypothetical protein